MSTLTFSVPGVSCEHCQAAIAGEVRLVPGVASVEVDLASKTVTISGDPLDQQALVAAIDQAGYDVAP